MASSPVCASPSLRGSEERSLEPPSRDLSTVEAHNFWAARQAVDDLEFVAATVARPDATPIVIDVAEGDASALNLARAHIDQTHLDRFVGHAALSPSPKRVAARS